MDIASIASPIPTPRTMLFVLSSVVESSVDVVIAAMWFLVLLSDPTTRAMTSPSVTPKKRYAIDIDFSSVFMYIHMKVIIVAIIIDPIRYTSNCVNSLHSAQSLDIPNQFIVFASMNLLGITVDNPNIIVAAMRNIMEAMELFSVICPDAIDSVWHRRPVFIIPIVVADWRE